MKTIRQWLEELPTGYRERAIANISKAPLCQPTDEAESMVEAISRAYIWANTPEGGKFWGDVDSHYCNGDALPPIPDESSPSVHIKPITALGITALERLIAQSHCEACSLEELGFPANAKAERMITADLRNVLALVKLHNAGGGE